MVFTGSQSINIALLAELSEARLGAEKRDCISRGSSYIARRHG